MEKPRPRSRLRLMLGMQWYGLRRRLLWIRRRKMFAKTREKGPLPYLYAAHRTPLRRNLKDVEAWMQENKIANLKLAAEKLHTVVLRPGEVFSYWRLIGKPTGRRGYRKGMVLRNGALRAGMGGGLCQMSNLIFWMTLHTPLTVIERHRHGYDVFPDAHRTQPFGSGATCFYPHGDLMIQNNTLQTYQLMIHVGDDFLEGEWRVSAPPRYRYQIVERNHQMRGEFWGGYIRHNELYQQRYTLAGEWINEVLAVKNDAVMMYAPFLMGREHSDGPAPCALPREKT